MKNIYEILKTHPQNLWKIEEVKSYLRISHNYDDQIIDNLINAAIEAAEKFMGLYLNIREIKLIISHYDSNIGIRLRYLPVAVLQQIIKKSKTSEIELIGDDYYLDQSQGKLYLKDYIEQDRKLIIFYQAGFKEGNIPAILKQGIIEHIAHMYDKSEQMSGVLSNNISNFYLPYRFLRV